MKRLLCFWAVMSLALMVASGCANKKSGCKGCKGCKTPCETAKKAPCDTAQQAPCNKPCDTPCNKATQASFKDFGEPMKLADNDTVCIKKVLAEPENFDGKFIRVAGKVESVCAKRGCWMRLTDDQGKDTLFVKFTCPVEGHLVPMEAVGHTAWVEGTFKVMEIPQDEARHYQEDAGASPEEIAKIVGPQKSLRMSAPAARIVDL